jgi:hypothetical protein
MIDLLRCNHASGYQALKHSAFVAAAELHKVSLYFDIVRPPIPVSKALSSASRLLGIWSEGSCSEDPLLIDVC